MCDSPAVSKNARRPKNSKAVFSKNHRIHPETLHIRLIGRSFCVYEGAKRVCSFSNKEYPDPENAAIQFIKQTERVERATNRFLYGR